MRVWLSERSLGELLDASELEREWLWPWPYAPPLSRWAQEAREAARGDGRAAGSGGVCGYGDERFLLRWSRPSPIWWPPGTEP